MQNVICRINNYLIWSITLFWSFPANQYLVLDKIVIIKFRTYDSQYHENCTESFLCYNPYRIFIQYFKNQTVLNNFGII